MTRFRLVLAERATGIVLTANGVWDLSDRASLAPKFTSWEDALRSKDELLRKYPFAEVVITDESGEREPTRFVVESPNPPDGSRA